MPFARVNGIKLYYNAYGRGEPVVFIHGVGITSRVWDFQKEGLSKDFRMIVYDLRGSGRSSKTVDQFHTAELLAEDLKGLLDYLKVKKVHLVGLSMGAAVAMKFAIEYPHRVKTLILSGAFSDLTGLLNFTKRYLSGIVGKLLMTRFFGELATKMMLPSAPKHELLYYHKNIISVDRDEIKKYRQVLSSYSITSALNKITAPTLIMYGEHEPVMHKYGRLISKKIRNSKMVIVSKVGHGWNGEDPELFNAMVAGFIRKHT